VPKDDSTEERILKVARKIFLEKGFAATRMQNIATEADINKAMLHYYFRSKQKLFERIFRDAISEIAPGIFSIMRGDLPLEQKVQQLVAFYSKLLAENPQLPGFVIHEIQQDQGGFLRLAVKDNPLQPANVINMFMNKLDKELNADETKPYIDPKQFFISLIGLTVFPFIAKPIMMAIFGLDEDAFQQFIKERMDFIPEFMMAAIGQKASD